MADPKWVKDLRTLPEEDLETISQEIKKAIFVLRDQRILIKDERIRRYQLQVLRAKLGELTAEEREAAAALLAEGLA